jgi:hypothetical protein
VDLRSIYPVRKPQHLCWGWWKYLQKQEHQLLIEGGVKALPFLTGFTFPRKTKLNLMSKKNQKLSNFKHSSNLILKNSLFNQVIKKSMLA